jgi:hypothetical protein
VNEPSSEDTPAATADQLWTADHVPIDALRYLWHGVVTPVPMATMPEAGELPVHGRFGSAGGKVCPALSTGSKVATDQPLHAK